MLHWIISKIVANPWKGYDLPPYYVTRQGHGPGSVFSALQFAGPRPIHMKLPEPILLEANDVLVGGGKTFIGHPKAKSVFRAQGMNIVVRDCTIRSGAYDAVAIKVDQTPFRNPQTALNGTTEDQDSTPMPDA